MPIREREFEEALRLFENEIRNGELTDPLCGNLQKHTAGVIRGSQATGSHKSKSRVDQWTISRSTVQSSAALYAVAIHSRGEIFASGGADADVHIGDVEKGQARGTLRAVHASTIRTLCFSRNNPYILSGGDDRLVMATDLESGRAVSRLFGHSEAVLAVAEHPEIEFIVTASRDKHLRVWDLRTSRCAMTIHAHTAAVAAVAVSSADPQITSCGDDFTVRLWDLRNGKEAGAAARHSRPPRSVLLAPAGLRSKSAYEEAERTVGPWARD